jgi:hypothetical protein
VTNKAAGLLGLLIGVVFWTSASADAYLVNTTGSIDHIEIEISGEITQQDFAFVSSRSKDFEFIKPPRVFLNSPGGDVDVAMKIGRIIRSVDGETVIVAKARCYSSCALIFIAGVERFNIGELGLHRPYFAGAPLTREQIEKQMPVMRSAEKNYVEEMGITDGFFERMFNTDPSAIAIYRGDESEKIVPHTDPTYDEISTSQSAQMHGVTTLEYRRRESLAESCINFASPSVKEKYPDCHESIMWGLSPDVYRSRSAMVKIRCDAGLSESEKEHFNATPRKDRILLPFAVRIYACRVNTMLAK